MVDGVIGIWVDVGGNVVPVLFSVPRTIATRVSLGMVFIYKKVGCTETDRRLATPSKSCNVPILTFFSKANIATVDV